MVSKPSLQCYCSGIRVSLGVFTRSPWNVAVPCKTRLVILPVQVREGKEISPVHRQWRIILWTAGNKRENVLQNNQFIVWFSKVCRLNWTGCVSLSSLEFRESWAPSWRRGSCNQMLTRPMSLGFVRLSNIPCPSSLANNEIISLLPVVTAKSYADCPFVFFFLIFALQL